MSLVCAQCSRVNPPEAGYCYYDGAALAGRAGGPINAGSAPFPNQFVFPDGMACRNFDQLAMACQQNWASAISLLQQGFLGSFFGGMGRVDLAMAAQEAARFPDLDRGLDQLLAKLPTQALQNPKIQAEPSEINLGQLKIGEDRASELHLTNLGMRLLYGTVTSDCDWLTVGEGAGHVEKMFQFGSEAIIPVHVRGQHLRAGARAVEGHLIVDSNGGTTTVTVKVDVPITPYPQGPFSGAVTPRQIAEKSKANPKGTAPLFENGDVARWYASNGWKYPVNGPIMPGVGAVQQFFEALGVAKPPRVEFRPQSFDLNGAVGKTVNAAVEIITADKKVVYGWATCDQGWVEIGKTKLGRAAATVPISIRIPDPCPPTVQATLTVVGNGNQKSFIPLSVKVAGGKAGVVLAEELPPVEIMEDMPIVEIMEAPAGAQPTPVPVPVMVIDEPARRTTPMPATSQRQTPMPATQPGAPPMMVSELVQDESPFAITGPPPSTSTLAPKPGSKGLPLVVRLVLHVLPLAVLSFFCLILMVCDLIWPGRPRDNGPDEIDKRPFVELKFDEGRTKGPNYRDSMTFALHKIDRDNPGAPKLKLNYYENGLGNSTVVKIDGVDKAFGKSPKYGLWAKGSEKGTPTGKWGGMTRTFDMDGIRVTQTVTIEPSDPIEVAPGQFKRLLNMALVRYKIENRDPARKKHSVGLRVLMDTYIGDRDDVPFTLPGVSEIVSTQKDFFGDEVPDFIQVLQKPSLRDPGIVMQLNMRFAGKGTFEEPSRFQLTRYPGQDANVLDKWEIPRADMGDDSSVAIYWEARDLGPGESREYAFTYGLGTVAVASNNKLGLTIGGATYLRGEFTVVALVADRDARTAKITLPEGLTLVGGAAEQPVPRMRPDATNKVHSVPITWRVRADREGRHNISVSTDTGATQSKRVVISQKSLFN
jgi:hypothetical protein